MGAVYIAEESEDGLDGELFLPGTFQASWQTESRVEEEIAGVTASKAISWARERTDDVFIRLGIGDYFWAGLGAGPADVPVWPPPGMPELARRRHPAYAYLDRTPQDVPIEWRVQLWIGPLGRDDPDGRDLWLEDNDAVIASIARAAGATWDGEQRRRLHSDLQKAARAAARRGHPDEYGWTSSGRDAYRLTLITSAATSDQAADAAREKLDLPPDLVLEDFSAVPMSEAD